jgi:poly(A) polymerase
MVDSENFNLDFLPDDREGIYLVGGTVRDMLTGVRPADIDIVADRDVTHVARRIAHKTGGTVVDLGKKGFAVLRVASPAVTVDITPLDQASIEADLRQRDFTINAMAYDVAAQRLVDCTGGQVDMQRRIIRMVSPSAFENDPARLIRAYRMAAVFHFSITEDTQAAIRRFRHLIGNAAGERIWSELAKIFSVPDSATIIRNMGASGLLTAIFPELLPAVGCTQSRPHHHDVFDHSILAYEQLETLLRDFCIDAAGLPGAARSASPRTHAVMLKYSALLHDVGKPATRQVDASGRIRFPGHAATSADIAGQISRRLKLSRKQREAADTIIRHHIRPLYLYLAADAETVGRRGIIRFFKACGQMALPIIVHAMADIMAKGKHLEDRDRGFIAFGHHLIREYEAFENRQAAAPPLIGGHDLIDRFGLSPSPRFKQILAGVDERRLAGELTTREEALKWVGEYLKRIAGR